jgi:hypothetical protein
MALTTCSDATTQFAKLVIDCCSIAGARIFLGAPVPLLTRSGRPRQSLCSIDTFEGEHSVTVPSPEVAMHLSVQITVT